MGDLPIIFSAPMVRALLDGRKTQTRRVLRNQPVSEARFQGVDRDGLALFTVGCFYGRERLPYAPGDRLYVREAFVTGFDIDDEFGHPVGDRKVWYRATDSGLSWYDPDTETTLDNPPWKPSIHMPRWASRITLTVTEVRVQRLQEISEADAVAEGILWQEPTEEDRQWARDKAEEYGWEPRIDGVWIAPGTRQGYGPKPQRDNPQWGPTAAFAYRCLWNSLHGPDAWAANPWVVALTFTVRQGNIDDLRALAKREEG